jgi:hypothetical protein
MSAPDRIANLKAKLRAERFRGEGECDGDDMALLAESIMAFDTEETQAGSWGRSTW